MLPCLSALPAESKLFDSTLAHLLVSYHLASMRWCSMPPVHVTTALHITIAIQRPEFVSSQKMSV
jgi:hypothetical protein